MLNRVASARSEAIFALTAATCEELTEVNMSVNSLCNSTRAAGLSIVMIRASASLRYSFKVLLKFANLRC